MGKDQDKAKQAPEPPPAKTYIPQVYSAKVLCGIQEPMIDPQDFGREILVNAYYQGFASCCPDIVFW